MVKWLIFKLSFSCMISFSFYSVSTIIFISGHYTNSAIVCARSKDVYVESWILGTGLCHWIQSQYYFNTTLLCFSFTRTLSDNWMRCYYFHITYVLVMALQRNWTNGMYIYMHTYLYVCMYDFCVHILGKERGRQRKKDGGDDRERNIFLVS